MPNHHLNAYKCLTFQSARRMAEQATEKTGGTWFAVTYYTWGGQKAHHIICVEAYLDFLVGEQVVIQHLESFSL